MVGSTHRGGGRRVPRVGRGRTRRIDMMRRAVVLTALVMITLSATPTLAAAKKRAAPATTTTTTWPPLPATSTTVAWSDCGNGFECGTLSVPVDWRAPTG